MCIPAEFRNHHATARIKSIITLEQATLAATPVDHHGVLIPNKKRKDKPRLQMSLVRRNFELCLEKVQMTITSVILQYSK